MTALVTLRDTATGEAATFDWPMLGPFDDEWPADRALQFHWVENNWSCDCNRALEWMRRVKRMDEGAIEAVGTPCGHERYELVALTLDGVSVL